MEISQNDAYAYAYVIDGEVIAVADAVCRRQR